MENLITYLASIFILISYSELFNPQRPDREDCDFCTMGSSSRCFMKSDWCDRTKDCTNGKDESYCNRGYPNCSSYQDNCYSGRCIPKSWICDDQVDCRDGSDEDCVLGTRSERLRFLSPAKTQFKDWALSQRRVGWGWEKDTPRAIVGLYLMNTSEYSSGNMANELSAKDLETQLLFDVFRNQTVPLGEGELALYLHATLATCLNTKHFHGLDIVSILRDKISKSNFVRPITLLALCNAGHPISQEYVDALKNITTKPNHAIWIDTKALAVMALICVERQTEDETLNKTIFDALLELKSFQAHDGGFGDARTSAVIMQALVGYKDYRGWDVTKGLQYLVKQHRNDSGGLLTNYLIMPLLSQRTLLDLRKVDCSYKNKNQLRNVTLRETFQQKLGKKIHVQYSVQIGDQSDLSYTCQLRIPVNTSFYDVMRLASELDARYKFQWRSHLGAKYIYSMNSIVNDPELRKYWTLYTTQNKEESHLITADVDKIYPRDSDHYIFWYKTVLE